MNTPTDIFRQISLFRLFLKTYFYNQNQSIIEYYLKEYLPSVSSISYDPYNYAYKVKCNISNDLDQPIIRALIDSFHEGGLNPKFIKDNISDPNQRDIVLEIYHKISLQENIYEYFPMLFGTVKFSISSKTLHILL